MTTDKVQYAQPQVAPGAVAAARGVLLPRIDLARGRIDLNHGAGGRATAQLVAQLFEPALRNPYLNTSDDAAVVPGLVLGQEAGGADADRLVIACDAHVVSPIFFPGGDLGSLAVYGTLNDLAVMGARALYLSAAFIMEEGFPLADLDRLARSMGAAARAAGVAIVTGDTKVVERNKADGVFITTTGIGLRAPGVALSSRAARVGDRILVSGSIGDHGVAVISRRESFAFETEIVSDSADLTPLVMDLLEAGSSGLRVLRDPTRGGLATALNEIAHSAQLSMQIHEEALVISPQVRAACELLGLDPLYIANEGKLLAICSPEAAPAILQAMQGHRLGAQAAMIGEVCAGEPGSVMMQTRLGGWRMLDWLAGDPLPRIC